MAIRKQSSEPSKKSNNFRLVVFEGDFSDDSVSQIAQALSSALRPSNQLMPRIPATRKAAHHLSAPEEINADQPEEPQEIEGEVIEPEEQETDAQKSPRAPRAKTYKNPDFVEMDWNGVGESPLSLKEFASEKAPKSRNRKYLVAAYWLKEHGGHPNVNINMMYSCFKTAGWSVGFKDWRAPFDNLVHSDHLRKVATGEFTITTLGEGALQTPEA